MNLLSLDIGINGASFEEVSAALEELGLTEKLENIRLIFRVKIELYDFTEAYVDADKFLKEHNMEDHTPFLNSFDITPYGVTISFSVNSDFKYLDLMEPLVFVFAGKLSKILNAKCLVAYEKLTVPTGEKMIVPAGLFDNGKLADTFEQYSVDFFKDKLWIPNKIIP